MSTVIRAGISESNPYYIPKHRYYELKHFCLQYPEWKRQAAQLVRTPSQTIEKVQAGYGDPVYEAASRRELYLKKMKMVEQCAIEASPEIYTYLITCVTEGASFTYLHTYEGMPCGKEYFYGRYRKFFWCLDRLRE